LGAQNNKKRKKNMAFSMIFVDFETIFGLEKAILMVFGFMRQPNIFSHVL